MPFGAGWVVGGPQATFEGEAEYSFDGYCVPSLPVAWQVPSATSVSAAGPEQSFDVKRRN